MSGNDSDVGLRAMLQGDRQYFNLVDKTYLIQYPFIESNDSCRIIKFQDIETHEVLAGKLLLAADAALHNNLTRQLRHKNLAQYAIRSAQFAPEGICIGLRPIIMGMGDLVYCGAVANPRELDPRFEYIWFMHLLEAGKSIEESLQRNVAILRPLANAVHDLHSRASPMSTEEAWRVASPEKLYQKLLTNLTFFERALPVIRGSVPEAEWNILWPDACTRRLVELSEAVHKSNVFVRAFTRRVEHGGVKTGHGDIKTKNIWYSDYHRDDAVRDFKDCVTFFDPIEPDGTFASIDTLSEAAMLLVCLQRTLGHVDFSHFVYYYTKLLPYWHGYDELVLTYYIMEKAMVNTYFEALFDNNLTAARKYLWTVRPHMHKLGELAEKFAARPSAGALYMV